MVERCELTLQSRLEPPTLTKDTSIGMYIIFFPWKWNILQRHFRICNIKISKFFVKSIYTFFFPRLNWNRRLNFGFGSFSLYYTASCSGTPASRGFTFIGYYRFTFFKLKNFCENEVWCQWYFVCFLQIHQIAAVAFLRFPHLLWKKVLHHHPQHTKWVSVSGYISEFFVKSILSICLIFLSRKWSKLNLCPRWPQNRILWRVVKKIPIKRIIVFLFSVELKLKFVFL